MIKHTKALKKYILTFALLMITYMAALVLAFCIPNSALQHNYEMSIGEFDRGTYWYLDNALTGTKMDGRTDKLILDNCIVNEDNSAIYNAMDVNNYARYWHGSLVLLRPLLVFFKLKYIKYISMVLCFVLLCAAYRKICERLGAGVGVSFVVSICMGNIICIPLSLQYMSVYYVTILAVICYLMLYERYMSRVCDLSGFVTPGLFFFAVGSFINFFDLLTTPIVTLGIPLVIAFLLYVGERGYTAQRGVIFIIRNSAAWLFGYAFTWLFKWVAGSIILKRNVISDAMNTVFYRTGSSGEEPSTRADALINNLENMFPKGAIAILGVLAVILVISAFAKRLDMSAAKRNWPVLIVAAYSFVWIVTLANHSQIHAYFTYRTFEIFIFAVLAYFASMLVPKKKEAG